MILYHQTLILSMMMAPVFKTLGSSCRHVALVYTGPYADQEGVSLIKQQLERVLPSHWEVMFANAKNPWRERIGCVVLPGALSALNRVRQDHTTLSILAKKVRELAIPLLGICAGGVLASGNVYMPDARAKRTTFEILQSHEAENHICSKDPTYEQYRMMLFKQQPWLCVGGCDTDKEQLSVRMTTPSLNFFSLRFQKGPFFVPNRSVSDDSEITVLLDQLHERTKRSYEETSLFGEISPSNPYSLEYTERSYTRAMALCNLKERVCVIGGHPEKPCNGNPPNDFLMKVLLNHLGISTDPSDDVVKRLPPTRRA